MTKEKWFLHARAWKETGGITKSGQRLFVVCPEIQVSIELKCSVGYGSKFQTLEEVTPIALKKARKVAEQFEVSPVIGESVTQGIVGQRFYLPAI